MSKSKSKSESKDEFTPRVEQTFPIACDLDTQRYAVARYIHRHLWCLTFIVEQGVGSEVFFFHNIHARKLWKKFGHRDDIATSVIQFIGGTGGFKLLHNADIDQNELKAMVMKARRANAMPVHIYYERLAEVARANKGEEFRTTFSYAPMLFTWSVETVEAAEGHSFIGGAGQTPEHACHDAMDSLNRALSDWHYTNPFEGE